MIYNFEGGGEGGVGALSMYLIVTFGTCMKYAIFFYHFKELFDIHDLE
jgi:hypothetical protein